MDGMGVAGMIITSDDWDHSRNFPAFSTSKIQQVVHHEFWIPCPNKGPTATPMAYQKKPQIFRVFSDNEVAKRRKRRERRAKAKLRKRPGRSGAQRQWVIGSSKWPGNDGFLEVPPSKWLVGL